MFKKILSPILAFLKAIYSVFDKILITPISRLMYKIGEISRDNSGKLEKILNRPNVLIYISLICAVAIFVLVDTQVINLTSNEAEIIEGQKVSVEYNQEAYVIEGVPETVDITLIGNKSTIYLARQFGEHNVTLDLTDYGTGTYKVKLKYNHSVQSVDYKLDPSVVTVKISEKVSEVKSLSYDLLNEDKLDAKLSISEVKLDTNEVIVKSSEEILSKVAVVKALIDASQIDLKESGNYKVENVVLVAYDNLGNKIENVEMVPSKVSATVTIDSYHAKKQVRVQTTGKMTNGKAISSITTSVKEVEVYGEKEIVDAIEFIYAELPIDNLSGDKTLSVNLIRPSGVRYMSDTTTNITVKVENQSQRTISGIQVGYDPKTLSTSYTAGTETPEEKIIDVIVSGVDSVIKDIDSSIIKAEVDLSGLKPGKHTVPVKVTITDSNIASKVTVKPVKTEVTIVIK